MERQERNVYPKIGFDMGRGAFGKLLFPKTYAAFPVAIVLPVMEPRRERMFLVFSNWLSCFFADESRSRAFSDWKSRQG